MPWNSAANGGFSDAPIPSHYAPIINDKIYGPLRTNVEFQQRDPSSLWNTIRHMIRIRKEHPAFSRGKFEWIDFRNDHIAGFQRTFEGETILAIHNLSNSQQGVLLETKEPVKSLTNVLARNVFVSKNGEVKLDLAPYQYLWLK